MDGNSIISSFLPFPPISWWAKIVSAPRIILDRAEHFEKMSYRNRYAISGANNPIQLSIPLIKGRNQRTPMAEVKIHNGEAWQVQHWRTLVSVYRQSPFWEYYEYSLQPLFERPFDTLIEFNLETTLWAMKQLKISQIVDFIDEYLPQAHPGVIDLRHMKPALEKSNSANFPRYYQMFEERIGFQPNLSILDLLCSEGPQTAHWLQSNF